MTIAEEKQALRREVRAAERALDPLCREASDRAIAARLLALPLYREAGTVFCFVSTSREIDTRPILKDVLATGRRLCVPRCAAGREMELAVLSSLAELEPGAYGILEPKSGCTVLTAEDVDFAVLPCVSADRRGRRLGQGGGYYDRFLRRYRGKMAVVCREALLRPHSPQEEHDVCIPWVLTEDGVFPGETAPKVNDYCIT